MTEDLVGKVAVCSRGIAGVITGRKELPWGESWVGKKINNGEPWASRKPTVIADSLDEYMADEEKQRRVSELRQTHKELSQLNAELDRLKERDKALLEGIVDDVRRIAKEGPKPGDKWVTKAMLQVALDEIERRIKLKDNMDQHLV